MKKEFYELYGFPELYKKIGFLWVAFLCVNILFSIYVLRIGIHLPEALETFFYEILPVINQPVDYLKSNSNGSRADLVRTIYSFNWLSFIPFLLGHIILTKKYHTAIHQKNSGSQILPKISKSKYAFSFLVLISLTVLVLYRHLYDGAYRFESDNLIFSVNAVHIRFFDFFRLSILMCLQGIVFFMLYYISSVLLLSTKLKKNSTRKGGGNVLRI